MGTGLQEAITTIQERDSGRMKNGGVVEEKWEHLEYTLEARYTRFIVGFGVGQETCRAGT